MSRSARPITSFIIIFGPRVLQGMIDSSLKGLLALNKKVPLRLATLGSVGKKKRSFGSLTELQEYLREQGRVGGKIGGPIGGKLAAKRMTKAQRVARAKKAAAASAKVRSKKARDRKKAEKAGGPQ
jgi:hypothetical protein